MHAVFYFKDSSSSKTLTRHFVTDTEITTVYYNDLKQADNSVRLQIPFDLEFANAIQQYFKSYTQAQIVDGANAIFTGFLRKTATFTKEQRAQPISVELITAGTLFDF